MIDGVVEATDFHWDDPLEDRTPQVALAKSLIEIVRRVGMGDG